MRREIYFFISFFPILALPCLIVIPLLSGSTARCLYRCD